jgi:hypothetical protein
MTSVTAWWSWKDTKIIALKSNHWSKIDREKNHGNEVDIASFWLLVRYSVPHSPWETGKAGDNRCFSNKNRCYSNYDTK